MRAALSLSSAILLSAMAAATGCSSRDGASESNEAPVSSSDLAMAKAAVKLIAGSQAHCNTCHTASKADMRRWGAAMQAVETSCLSPSLTLTPEQRVACISDDPTDSTASFSASKLGFYAAAATHAEIKNLFGASDRYTTFQQQAAMPAGAGTALTEPEFASVKKWVLAGMPALDDVLGDPDFGPCTTSLTPGLSAHLAEMKSDGWAARLKNASTSMFGCGTASDPAQCLTSLPDVTSALSAPGAAQTLRKLRDLPGATSFWVRSSADGRYSGIGGPGRVVDHAAGPDATPIATSAPYDPTFFPNNDGFGFAGAGSGGIRVCRQNILAQPPARITFTEPGCNAITSSVYQTVGAALDGSIFFMSTGVHVNDFGSEQGPVPGFDSNAYTTLTPMLFDGVKYTPQAAVNVSVPYEGDQALSPSNKLLITRFGGSTGSRGFRVRRLSWSSSATGGFSVDTEVLGNVCLNGAKPVMSFDERFIVTHQYVDPGEGTGMPVNTANIFLADLATGRVTQLTKVGPKQLALFPHFRADGWIYFLLKDKNTGKESLVASDAAVRAAATP
jgi:hypothetical protein